MMVYANMCMANLISPKVEVFPNSLSWVPGSRMNDIDSKSIANKGNQNGFGYWESRMLDFIICTSLEFLFDLVK